MQYTSQYKSPLGNILLAADEIGLTGLWFEGQKYFALYLDKEHKEKDLPVLQEAKRWLDIYFAGKEPNFIAQILAGKKGLAKMSAQAVGGAVGHNEISIIVPCHRVVGASGSLTGYAGGINKKIELLKLEGAWREDFFVPQKSTAP